MRRTPALALALVALTSVGCSSGADPIDVDIAGLTSYPVDSRAHVTKDVTYPQSPPVGGDHWEPLTGDVFGWQRCATYTEPVIDEFAVHSLEHGAVWLTYRPGASAADVAALDQLASTHRDYVLVSPYDGQAGAFGATVWGAQLFVESPADPRLAAMVKAFAGGGQGGEKGAPCANGATLDQARTLVREAG